MEVLCGQMTASCLKNLLQECLNLKLKRYFAKKKKLVYVCPDVHKNNKILTKINLLFIITKIFITITLIENTKF